MEQTLLHMLSEYTHLYFNTYFKIPNCNLISFLEGKERQYQHNNNKLFLIQLVYIHTAYHEKEKNIEKAGKCDLVYIWERIWSPTWTAVGGIHKIDL